MARPIINADEHLIALGRASRHCISMAAKYAQTTNPSVVRLYSQDIDRISSELKGSGFDLGRGFKICGIKVIAFDAG